MGPARGVTTAPRNGLDVVVKIGVGIMDRINSNKVDWVLWLAMLSFPAALLIVILLFG